MSQTRVFIADDHALLRSGLRVLIAAQPDMAVVGEAGTLQDTIAGAAKVKPDVITLDLSMPGASGVAGVKRLLASAPGAKVLVLTMHDDPAYMRAAIAMGASGFLAKSAADTELISAIRAVALGRLFVDMKGTGSMATTFLPDAGPAPLSTLSEREREVMTDVANGYTSQQIADRLSLSVKTIESYRARLMQKLGLKTRADLMRVAMDSGLLKDKPAE
jgi:DNA-binding NarL/FixJ family response regulator